MVIRTERPEEHEAVRRINEIAFGGPAEADLVDALREASYQTVSLVAVREGRVAGHIFFSPVSIGPGSPRVKAVGLGPMAVAPELQNQGIGSSLVRRGLEECLHLSIAVVVVVGHPNFYPRFGFSPARSKGLECEFPVPGEAFMVAELSP